MPPKKPRKTLIQAIKKMKGKAVMQSGDNPTGDDDASTVQPVVEGVGQVITIVERGEHPRGRGRGAGSRGCGIGRGDKDIVAEAMEEADVGAEKEDEYGGTSSEDETEVPAQKKKKTAEVVLTPEQEQTVCDWLREFPQVWNTRHESYRKTPEKDLLWEEQGQKMGLTGSHLKQWYRSTRSKFGRVKTKKGKSGSGAQPALTFREETVWQLFQFLGDFVKEKANREPVASLRKRIAAQAPAHTPPSRDPSPVRDEEPTPRPRGAAPPPPAAETPDAAPLDPLVDLQRQGTQLLVSHRAALDAVIGIKGPHKDRSAYCDYLNQCGQQLNQELWSSFKRESFRFMESLLEQQSNRQNPQPQLQPAQLTKPGQVPFKPPQQPRTSYTRPAPAEISQWQPPPHCWPQPQQLATQPDVWGSQEPAWMARNIQGFNYSCPPPDQQPDTARPSSCPNPEARLSDLSLSGFGGSQTSELNTPTFHRSLLDDEVDLQQQEDTRKQ